MKKVLVTGASGFVGNYVVRQLLSMNCSVIATSSDAEKGKQHSWFKSVKYIPFNLLHYSDRENYHTFFDRPDYMIHLAWEGLPNYKSLFHIEENLPRHYAFLKNIIVNGLQDLTVTGTCLEYGLQQGSLSEDMPTFPSNPYALAKESLRKFLVEIDKLHPFVFKWVRLFYLYGKGQNPNSILSQLDKAIETGETSFNMSGGEQIRDYLPVAEAASMITRIALQKQVRGIVNCCSGNPVSVKQFVTDYCIRKKLTINLNLGYHPYTDYEPMRFWGNIEKLKKAIQSEITSE